MNIWIINQYAIPPDTAGITRAFVMARELIAHGHDVTIIASSFDHVSRTEKRLKSREGWKIEIFEGVRFLWLRTPAYSGNGLARVWNMSVFAVKALVEPSKHLLKEPDIIVGSSPHLFGALAAERLATRLNVPFVLEVRDLWPQSLIDLGNLSRGTPSCPPLQGWNGICIAVLDTSSLCYLKQRTISVRRAARRIGSLGFPTASNSTPFQNLETIKTPSSLQ